MRQFEEFMLCNVSEAFASTESFVSNPVPSSKFQACRRVDGDGGVAFATVNAEDGINTLL